jgi:FixJ family two-component response regulator
LPIRFAAHILTRSSALADRRSGRKLRVRAEGDVARQCWRARVLGERPLRKSVYIVAPVPEESGWIRDALSIEGLDVRVFDGAEGLMAALTADASGCVVVPVDLPGIGVRRLIEEIRRRGLCLAVVVLGREDDLRVAVDLVRAGASEFVEHPPSARRLLSAVRRAIAADAHRR